MPWHSRWSARYDSCRKHNRLRFPEYMDHKDTAGVLDSLRDSGVIRCLDNQVLGSVLVREVYDFPRIFQYDDTAVR